ncbi:MAG: hypothetical protein Crog4KO_05110 [Crocinitomicaceae bacterium]
MITDAEREEKERAKRERIRKLESPIPFVIILRNWMFGKKKPDILTRITFLANFVIWILFLIWSCFSYFAVNSRQWIWEQKGLAVTWIIERRGEQLNYEKGEFLARLEFTSLMALLCWLLFFVGLVLLYRKKKIFIYFTLVPLLAYIAMNSFYLGFNYFVEDITLFDKILFLISGVSLLIAAFMIRGGRDGSDSTSDFFGISKGEDVSEAT